MERTIQKKNEKRPKNDRFRDAFCISFSCLRGPDPGCGTVSLFFCIFLCISGLEAFKWFCGCWLIVVVFRWLLWAQLPRTFLRQKYGLRAFCLAGGKVVILPEATEAPSQTLCFVEKEGIPTEREGYFQQLPREKYPQRGHFASEPKFGQSSLGEKILLQKMFRVLPLNDGWVEKSSFPIIPCLGP